MTRKAKPREGLSAVAGSYPSGAVCDAVTTTGSQTEVSISATERQFTICEDLMRSVSPERLGTYLMAAGFDQERALKLYLWNVSLGEAFHLPIQCVEVALRNSINSALRPVFSEQWWEDETFLRISGKAQKQDISTARTRIQNRKQTVVNGQMVATLSFGFWVAMLQPRYNPDVWSKRLRDAFPYLPSDKTRYNLADSAQRVATLRNRIWHHEPIFKMNLSEEHSAALELLGWISPAKAAWVRPFCRAPIILRQRP